MADSQTPGRKFTRIADFSLTPVIDMNWLVRFFWAVFEAMLAMPLPQQACGQRGMEVGNGGELDEVAIWSEAK